MARKRKKQRTWPVTLTAVALGGAIILGSCMFAWLFQVRAYLAPPSDLVSVSNAKTNLVVDPSLTDGAGR